MTTRAEWLAEAPFTLVLSGGFFGFFSHTGLLSALESADLRPQRIVGCSAGALAGGAWASGVPAEALEEQLRRLKRDEFWDPGLPLGGLLRGRKFVSKLERVLSPTGVARIEDTRLAFTAIVHDVFRHRTRALQAGSLALAIRASCTVPLLFRPVRWGGTLLVDGGVSDRSGLSAVPKGERVLYHHLLSTRPGARQRGRPLPGDDRACCERLAIPDLPRVSPFRLEQGPLALDRVRQRAARWLEAPRRVPGAPAPSRA